MYLYINNEYNDTFYTKIEKPDRYYYDGKIELSSLQTASIKTQENGQEYELKYYYYDSNDNVTSFELQKKNIEPTSSIPTEYDTLMLYTAQFVVTDDVALTISDIYPEWSADSVAYKLNEKVRYDDLLYKCLNAHTSQATWTPTDAPSLWVRIDDPAEEWPEWRQPTGATDAYAKGAKVSHNSKHWVSNTENNVWEPGVYGWDEQTA